ncbi:lysylphosphatidylglycerol synthase domain-containing protein [Streptomyces sp. C10-9-1]|uniref:lysylphosphatidylglycerol synthase domain-containing protein n=1 Tax=Streptomyces sp. C10-9-1 TaxID=1859285 RepID=UPI003D74E853
MTIDRLRRILTPVIVVAALVGVYLVVRGEGPEAARSFARAEVVPLLAASLAANVAGLVLAVHAWRVLLPGDHPIRGLYAAKVYFLGQLSKYVPGRVWGVLTHVAHGRAVGVPGSQMTSAYVLSLALTLLTGAAVSLAAAPVALPGHWMWLCLPALFFLASTLRPALVTRPVAAAARLARRPVATPPDGAVRRAVLLAVASWTASGLHLWFLVLALGAEPWGGLGAAVGGFALATVVSSLALIVPDGWGVRELTITAALATVLPAGPAAAAAIASRLVCVVAELGSAGLVLGWSRLRPAPAPAPTATPVTPVTPVTPATPATEPPPTGTGTPPDTGTGIGTAPAPPHGDPHAPHRLTPLGEARVHP